MCSFPSARVPYLAILALQRGPVDSIEKEPARGPATVDEPFSGVYTASYRTEGPTYSLAASIIDELC